MMFFSQVFFASTKGLEPSSAHFSAFSSAALRSTSYSALTAEASLFICAIPSCTTSATARFVAHSTYGCTCSTRSLVCLAYSQVFFTLSSHLTLLLFNLYSIFSIFIVSSMTSFMLIVVFSSAPAIFAFASQTYDSVAQSVAASARFSASFLSWASSGRAGLAS